MKNADYLNDRSEPLYVIHFPGSGLEEYLELAESNVTRSITISSKISIISIMNAACIDKSILKRQCDNNEIRIYNTAESERDWSNTLKIKHIIKCLDMISTKYALIIDGRDTVLTHDLDDGFIEKWMSFKKGVVYNGTPKAFPEAAVEPLQELLQIRGKQKFLNAGVCFGEVNILRSFYKKCEEVLRANPNTNSEQIIVRIARQYLKDYIGIDHNNDLFRICHTYDTAIKEEADNIILI